MTLLKRLLQRLGGERGEGASLFEPRMPSVEAGANLAAVFAQARATAADNERPAAGRNVVIVTPGRLLMMQPCPPPGSMPETQVAGIKKMIAPEPKRTIVAIAYTELSALQRDLPKAIPFIGMLMGFAYIGHAVCVFEGDVAALAYGCSEADLVIVDGAMVPFLAPDWATIVAGAMRGREIYIHDRATFKLQRWQAPS
ncbi:MAG: hypothetical protein HYR72_09995 [Deltaproteobacteria bacterium]|nr:hypothetical protein [Deltaproteobacteria bacterium]MBI3388031.1 hypothetical protein [Deltaproteobacteria bacterium]